MYSLKSETGGGKPVSLADLEKLAGSFAEDYDSMRAVVAVIEDGQRQVILRHEKSLQTAIARAQVSKAALVTAVQAHRELFDKKKTHIFAKIKFGFRKLVGKIVIADEELTLEKIKKVLPVPENFIITTEVPNKERLADLMAVELKKLGVSITDDGEAVVVTPVAGDVEKRAAALLENKVKNV